MKFSKPVDAPAVLGILDTSFHLSRSEPQLAYQFVMDTPEGRLFFFVNAQTGKLAYQSTYRPQSNTGRSPPYCWS